MQFAQYKMKTVRRQSHNSIFTQIAHKQIHLIRNHANKTSGKFGAQLIRVIPNLRTDEVQNRKQLPRESEPRNPNFGLTTKTFKRPHPGCLEAYPLLKMKRKNESPKHLTITNPTLPKGASMDHLNTSKINDAQKTMISLFKIV